MGAGGGWANRLERGGDGEAVLIRIGGGQDGVTLWGELQRVRPSGWNQNTELERREALGGREFDTGHCMTQLYSYANISTS